MLKNKYKNKVCYIVASGPSLIGVDLRWLKDELTIGVNRAYMITEPQGFVCTYHCAHDASTEARDIYDDYAKLDTGVVIASNAKRKYNYTAENLLKVVTFARRRDANKFHHDLDVTRNVLSGGTVVIDMAIPLAMHMGVTTIYLLGCDCNSVPDGEPWRAYGGAVHLGNRARRRHADFMSQALKAYPKVRDYALSQGVAILNAGVGGALHAFPRVSLSSLRTQLDVIRQDRHPLENKHRGKRCFVLVPGPSLLDHDISWLKDEITVALSTADIVCKEQGFEPTYVTSSDASRRSAKIQLPRWAKLKTSKLVLSNYIVNGWKYTPPNLEMTVDFAPVLQREETDYFDHDLGSSPRNVLCGGLVTVDLGLTLPMYLGCNPIYLVGCDHTLEPHVREVGGAKERDRDTYRKATEAFEVVGRYARERGFVIQNTTKSSSLTTFDYVDFDSLR